MKFSAAFITFVISGAGLAAANPHSVHHALLAKRIDAISGAKHTIVKRCKVRPGSSNKTLPTSTKSTSKTTSTKKETAHETGKAYVDTTPASGVIKVGGCGGNRAQVKTTAVAGPNGHIDWLNCGINDSGGWTPPKIHVSDLITKSLSESLGSSSSPFHACAAYVKMFEQYGDEFGIPAIMLASFAMQESSCNPKTIGGAGEQGLMQITKDKCGGAPGGNCLDPNFNIRTGAKYFAKTLDDNGGDVLISVGNYNGWALHLTEAKATAAAKGSCCRCQNNLDYLHQFFNGWLQGINAYSSTNRLGKYFNLDVCGPGY